MSKPTKIICTCSCHEDGEMITSCFLSCCKHAGKKYISGEKVDMKRLKKLEKEAWEKGWKDLGF